jgi:CRISPR-associated protein (TIGR02584 family)
MYVFLVLGQSPAVLAELLWWLDRVERTPIAGIEVWCTASAVEPLSTLLDQPVWTAFQHATQRLPRREPLGSPPNCDHGFRVHLFEADGEPLQDVRSEHDAQAVNALLHDRLRALRGRLRDRTPIVACIAGGRKSVSAALQTAFTMQARPMDRLVHVLLHRDLEAYLRGQPDGRDFLFPTEDWAARSGVPVDEQVLVHDLPVPRLRSLVPTQLERALAELDWVDVWPALQRNGSRAVRGHLSRTSARTWCYRVLDGDQVLFETSLPNRSGWLLAAIAAMGPDAGTADVLAWLDARRLENAAAWTAPAASANDLESRPQSIRTAANALRKALQDLPAGLERFSPAAGCYTMEDVEVDASG